MRSRTVVLAETVGNSMKKTITYPKYYLLSLGIILLLSFYPLLMGLQVLSAYVNFGYVNAADYPKYVIPYTPIALALILTVTLLPLAVRLSQKFALPIVSAVGIGAFLLFEVMFENVMVFYLHGSTDLGSWQLFLCYATPAVVQTIGEAFSEQYNPVFKVHFYLISILIVLAVLSIVYGFGKMIRDNNFDKSKPLVLQTIAVSLFIGLCIWANFTAFYRTGELTISSLSSWLMSIFFTVFGLTAGIYAGGLLYNFKPFVSRAIPSLVAAATTTAMYLAELVLMGGVLFRFGEGLLFNPLSPLPLALIDVIVILLAGALTYLLLYSIRKRQQPAAVG
jgi:hypothetical protein